MKILIVEDEPLAVRKLKRTIDEVSAQAEVIGTTNSIRSTVAWLKNNQAPDIILLDIELADGQSFEIFNQVEVKSTVIFTTSYNEFALKAFQVNSIDYLLKPVQKESLEKAFNKYNAIKKMHSTPSPDAINIEELLKGLQQKMYTASNFKKRFLVKNGAKLVSIEIEDIAYFYIEGRLVFFKTWQNKKFVVDYTMEELADTLNPDNFFRINRSCFATQKSISQIEDHLGGRLFVILNPAHEKEGLVSRERVQEFKIWMGK